MKFWNHSGHFHCNAAGLITTVLFMVVTALFILFATQFPYLYILATYEDLPGEWTQVFFFTATLIGSLFLIQKPHPYRFFFMLLALACFYVIGEEISWGQRLLSFASPDFFQRHNLQQEANLHNLFTGPSSTALKRIIEIGLVCGLIGFGLVYPLLQNSGNRSAQWLVDHGLPVPPLYLSPYFVAAALCEVRIFSFNEAEVAELLIAMALAFLTLHYNFYLSGKKYRTPVNGQLAMTMVGVVFFSVVGAGTLSWYSWNTPRLHEGMANRITAGQKKFALRYSRVGAWHHAEGLYKSALVKSPKNTYLLRQLAICYKQQGDEQRFTATINKAIRLDMMRFGRNPRRVSVNLSLFQNFQQTGNRNKAEFHLEKAMAESRDKVHLEPYNAVNFYWYGKSLQARGDMTSAREQFSRAVTMNPDSKKYRRAYMKSLRESISYPWASNSINRTVAGLQPEK